MTGPEKTAEGFNLRALMASRDLFARISGIDFSVFDRDALETMAARTAGLSGFVEALHGRLRDGAAPRVRTVRTRLETLQRTFTA